MDWIRRHAAEITIFALTIAAGAGVYIYAHRDEGALEESKRRGAAIVEALHRYHAEHGDYPASLEELAPRYASQLEPPTWGLGRWRYRRYSEADLPATAPAGGSAAAAPGAAPADSAGAPRIFFQLSVAANASGYPVLYYDVAASRWVLNN